ncbi:NAD(P)/FAD-dependent oxidoreductase [Maricurvus nonylphenolicus]|uniref:flavin-containing monooxygenase n=1 Tax=Maricurvus nonylphenolicus TaxID=1008307 RepID=UPI0036F2095A
MVDTKQTENNQIQHLDVLIVGAGISGVACAYHLQNKCPNKSFLMVESKSRWGGTWETHKYPGVRSDSDLYTFGYSFKPWNGVPIATAGEILRYMEEAIEENSLNDKITYNTQITSAQWSDEKKHWTVSLKNTEENREYTVTTSFLWMCAGYYEHDQGYTPDFPNMESFKGDIVHPQTWPEDYDYTGKKVLVIGSGATAATLIPAMAEDAEHVTMLQRSPTYFAPLENKNEMADMLRELDLPEEQVHDITRKKILHDSKLIHQTSKENPEYVKQALLAEVEKQVGSKEIVEKHFTPKYRPWQQRLAAVPNGDLFHYVREGKASVVTDTIESFVEEGILLTSGEVLEADIIITATGFNLKMLGGVDMRLGNGEPFYPHQSWAYRGVMFSGVPNFANVFGYLRTSWTMRAELIADYVCRLLNHMDEKGAQVVTPELRPEDEGMEPMYFIPEEDFNPGYMLRGRHLMPKRGDKEPWSFELDYYKEKEILPNCSLDDDALVYQS